MEKLQAVLSQIKPLDRKVMAETQKRLDSLTKPPGSLGVLEELTCQVAGITGQVRPPLPKKTCILMAGDHGVVAEGVSAFPQEVTTQMVLNFLRGGAAMNVLSRHVGSELIIVDVGVAADLPDLPGLLKRKVAYGTANMAAGPAMTRGEAVAALEVGIEVVQDCIARGTGLVGLGEMGIGNTTPSTAIIATYSGKPVAQVIGRGTGIDDERLKQKIRTVEKALAVNQPDPANPLDVLSKVGGLEVAALAGVVLGAAAGGIPVITDGFISTAAALIATELCPTVKEYLICSHLSAEPGHGTMLEYIGLKPLLHLDMRLGEGTGAALAMGLVEASLKILTEMATFAEAAIAGALPRSRK
ncbi:MAG TPA: nicotinate-nucleotide--dimethylbenzimidazole phosphoribosyltransferase [Firmicutes bacterium]|nr:nicotinate-nucleotide--dimethylbenzimidazole phosphoribosyltransferase [Bacillota bacterium]